MFHGLFYYFCSFYEFKYAINIFNCIIHLDLTVTLFFIQVVNIIIAVLSINIVMEQRDVTCHKYIQLWIVCDNIISIVSAINVVIEFDDTL